MASSKCDGLQVKKKKLGFRFGLYLEQYLSHWTSQILSLDLSFQICKMGKLGWLTSFQLRALQLPEGCTPPGLCRAGQGENRNPGSRKGPKQGPTLEKRAVLGSKGRGTALTCRLPSQPNGTPQPPTPLTATPSSSATRPGPTQSNQPSPATRNTSPQPGTLRQPILDHRRTRRRSGAPPPGWSRGNLGNKVSRRRCSRRPRDKSHQLASFLL